MRRRLQAWSHGRRLVIIPPGASSGGTITVRLFRIKGLDWSYLHVQMSRRTPSASPMYIRGDWAYGICTEQTIPSKHDSYIFSSPIWKVLHHHAFPPYSGLKTVAQQKDHHDVSLSRELLISYKLTPINGATQSNHIPKPPIETYPLVVIVGVPLAYAGYLIYDKCESTLFRTFTMG
jgi:hypothetical protein